MTGDRVGLTVPAKGEYAKVVRMTAAALASRLGMSYDDVEDVRMAVDEAFIYAVDGAEQDRDLTMVFDLRDGALTITVDAGVCTDITGEEAERRASLATFILDSVCDHYEFESEESGSRRLRITKQVKAADGD